jgi:hypothetical protein
MPRGQLTRCVGVGVAHRMRKKAVQQGRSERRGDAYSAPYVEPLSDARTPLADFFRILLGRLSFRRRLCGEPDQIRAMLHPVVPALHQTAPFPRQPLPLHRFLDATEDPPERIGK